LVRAGVFAAALGVPALVHAADVPFAAPVPIAAAVAPVERLAPADVDRDGDQDLLLTFAAPNTLAFLRNVDGAGTSWSLTTVSTLVGNPRDVAAADVDGDGDIDVVSASPSPTDRLCWHENLNDLGTAWATHTITSSPSFDVATADIDRDGDLDVLATGASGELRWFQNNGDGTAWVALTIATRLFSGNPVHTADIDRDGDLDVVADAGGPTWFENVGGGTAWTPHAAGTFGVTGLSSADMDRDGDADIVSGVAWYENGAFWTPHELFTSGTALGRPIPADVDGDGDLDVWGFESGGSGAIAWYDNLTADGLNWTRRTLATSSDATAVAVVDLDGDGDLDALSASGNVSSSVVRHRNETLHRNACFAPPANVSTLSEAPDFMVTADLDGDGDLDVITTHDTSSIVFWHESSAGAASWTRHTLATLRVFGPALTVGDVDRDGDVDVAGDFTGPAPALRKAWLENPGDGSVFTPHGISTFNNFYGAQIHVADMDGDGDPDLVESTGTGYGAFSRWYANTSGNGSSWSAGNPIPGDRGQLADFDRDGDLDVVAGIDFLIELFWLENANGTGTSWLHHMIAQPFGAYPLPPADLDGDGRTDVVNGGATIAWYRNLGFGTFGGPASIPSPAGYPFDLDGDGDVDQLGTGSGAFGWQENLEGTGLTWLAHTLPGTASARVTAADLDRDGDLDVLTGPLALVRHENRGGQYALDVVDQAPATIQQGNTVSMLRVVATHLGRTGDGALELSRFGLLLEEAAGDPLTTAEANLLVETLSVYRDANGNGVFDPAADVPVTAIDVLALTNGVQEMPFADGDPNVAVALGAPRTYFVLVTLTAEASTQNPNRLRVTLLQLGPSASRAEHAAYDIALSPACPADVSSGVMVASFPVELMKFTIE
jgi:hypothetical protein